MNPDVCPGSAANFADDSAASITTTAYLRCGGFGDTSVKAAGAARRISATKSEHGSKVVDGVLRLFRAWDTDGDGAVSRAEMGRLLRFVLNGKFSEDLLEQLMSAADTNGDGVIDLEEFMQWIYDPEKGMFSKDVSPSQIQCSTSPTMVSALKTWFGVMDVNNNGYLEYEEFVLAAVMVNEDANIKDVTSDYVLMDKNPDRKIGLPEFLKSYGQLLDAIPRPIEEKTKIVNNRADALARIAKQLSEDEGCPKMLTGKVFMLLLQSKFCGSLELAFQSMNVASDTALSITELQEAVVGLLELPKSIKLKAQLFRALLTELNLGIDGSVSVQELDRALSQATAALPRPSRKLSPLRTDTGCSALPALPPLAPGGASVRTPSKGWAPIKGSSGSRQNSPRPSLTRLMQ